MSAVQSPSRRATLLQEAEAQAGVAALSLQRYVIAEDAALPPGVQLASEAQLYANAGVETLMEAAAPGGVKPAEQGRRGGSARPLAVDNLRCYWRRGGACGVNPHRPFHNQPAVFARRDRHRGLRWRPIGAGGGPRAP